MVRAKKSVYRVLVLVVLVCVLNMCAVRLYEMTVSSLLQLVESNSRQHRSSTSERDHVSIGLFTSIVDIKNIPDACYAWQRVLSEFSGKVHLIGQQRGQLVSEFGFSVLPRRSGKLPRWSDILHIIRTDGHRYTIVGYFNNDVWPTLRTRVLLDYLFKLNLQHEHVRTARPGASFKLTQHEHSAGWLAVATRSDFDPHTSIVTPHTKGGSDLWLWNNQKGFHSVLGENYRIPPFRIARPYFDMWFVSIAIQTGFRHVIDITQAAGILHKEHSRTFHSWSEAQRRVANDTDWNNNYLLARAPLCDSTHQCIEYELGTGTTCEAPLVLDNLLNLSKRKTSVPYKCFEQWTSARTHGDLLLQP